MRNSRLALAILFLLDCGLAGFRVAVGRDGRIVKRDYYLAAIKRGVCLTLLGLGLGAAWLATYLSVFPESAASFYHAGEWAAFVYGAYAVAVLLALIVYAVGGVEIRTLATVILLGPFTAIRPVVIVLGAMVGCFNVPGAPSFLGAAYAVALGLLAEPLLNRWRLWRPLP